MVIATEFVARITTLGDSERYIAGPSRFSANFMYSSTEMMDTIASSVAMLAGDWFAHLFFLALASYGVYYSIRRVDFRRNQLLFLLVILSTPTFSIWTSIVSKESVVVFSLGLILGNFLNLVRFNRLDSKLTLLIGVYLLLVFKPHYAPAILILFISVYPRLRIESYELYIFFIFIFAFLAFLIAVFLNTTLFDNLAIEFPKHFSSEASGTRENWLWFASGDFLKNAPEGMFWALIGPFCSEAKGSIKYLIPFLESCIFMFFLLYVSIIYVYRKLNTTESNYVPVSFLIVVLSIIFIAFVHYPYGVLNPGAALRYRSGFFAFYAILIFYCYMFLVKMKYRPR
jgi:hypothetical protein